MCSSCRSHKYFLLIKAIRQYCEIWCRKSTRNMSTRSPKCQEHVPVILDDTSQLFPKVGSGEFIRQNDVKEEMEFGIMFVFHLFKVNRVMLQIAQRFALLVLLFANKTSALRSSTSRLPSRSGSAAHGQKHGEKLVRTEHDILEEHVLAVKGVCSASCGKIEKNSDATKNTQE